MSVIVFSSCLLLGWQAQQPPASGPPEPSAAAIVASVEKMITDAIATAEPSVVAIHRSKNESGQETLAIRGRKRGHNLPLSFPNQIRPTLETSNMISFDFGSGVVIGDHGEILTLFHVVRGAQRLIVRAPGKQEFDAEIIAADPRSDLAVIVPAVNEGAPFPRLKPLALGESTRLRKGAFLIALGNSFNGAHVGNASASWGILSNISRKIEQERDDNSNGPLRTIGLVHYPTLLQLDAKLNLGVSGGAVVNLKGELVGISTMASSPSGFDALAGYAIPMDKIIKRAIATLKEGREVEYGLLGINADDKFSNFVARVAEGSPAARGQLQVHDQIIAVNGNPVTDFESLILAVNAFAPGEPVRLKIRRDEDTIERTIVLAKLSVDGEVIATNRPKAWRGLRVEHSSTLYRGFNTRFGEPDTHGVVVVEIEDGSPAANSGIKRGQLIRKAGGKDVRSPQEFADAVAREEGPVTLETDLGQVTIK